MSENDLCSIPQRVAGYPRKRVRLLPSGVRISAPTQESKNKSNNISDNLRVKREEEPPPHTSIPPYSLNFYHQACCSFHI